jgi:antitoxin component YwqK of YwqJK toxin-antitoxin module
MIRQVIILCAVVLVVHVGVVGAAFAVSRTDTLWYSRDWKRVGSRYQASFFRLAPVKTDTGYRVIDYYVDGSLFMKGYTSAPEEALRTGYFTQYDGEGVRTSEGGYSKGLRNGRWLYYYGDGKRVRAEVFYSKDLMHGVSRDYDSAVGKSRLEGEWAMGSQTGTWKQYYTGTDRLYRAGTYRFGERDGEFKTYYMDGRLKRLDYYEAGHLTKGGKCYDPAGKQIECSPYYQDPAYLGDLHALGERMAQKAGFRKRRPFPDHTWFYFTITRKGTITDIAVGEPKGPVAAQIPWLVKKMARWRPMEVDGNYIACRVSCFVRVDETGVLLRPEFAAAEDFLSPLYPAKGRE